MTKVHMRSRPVPTPVRAATPEETPSAESEKKPSIQVVQAVPVASATEGAAEVPANDDDASLNDPVEGLEDTTTSPEPEGDDVDNDDDPDLSLLEPDAPTEAAAPAKPSAPVVEEMGFLSIYRPECLSCKALVPMMPKAMSECHWKKGNKNCPAQSVQIVERIPLNIIIPRWLGAEKAGEWSRIAQFAALLATKPDWYQQRVKDALEDARRSSTT